MWLMGEATAVGVPTLLLFCLCCSDEDAGPSCILIHFPVLALSGNFLGVGGGIHCPGRTRLSHQNACGCGTGLAVWADPDLSLRAWVFLGGLGPGTLVARGLSHALTMSSRFLQSLYISIACNLCTSVGACRQTCKQSSCCLGYIPWEEGLGNGLRRRQLTHPPSS